MENGGGFGSWAPLGFSSPYNNSRSNIAAAAATSSSSPSCSHFPDQLVVPAVRATGSGPHQLHYPHHQQQQEQEAQHHHITCLKLGKRQYYGGGGEEVGPVKRERAPTVTTSMGTIPRCQVEGCNKALLDAKDYHRRHKVCEIHSKAPKVVVLGSKQRFCQQCSRFHEISEFDDSKRSCRRRLAGHNERRRKSSSDSVVRNEPPSELKTTIMDSRFPYLPQTSPDSALSLLSSKASPWIPTPELSSRPCATLRQLIAENRATLLDRQLVSNRGWPSVGYRNQSMISFVSPENQEASHGTSQLVNGWNKFQESRSHLTLDLMQSSNSTSLEFLSGRNKSKEEEEECCEIWESLQGTHCMRSPYPFVSPFF